MEYLMLLVLAALLLGAYMVLRLLWTRQRGRSLAGWCAVCAGMLALLGLYFLPVQLHLDATQLSLLDNDGIVTVSDREAGELLQALNHTWFRRTLFESDGRDGSETYYHLTPRPTGNSHVSVRIYLPTATSPGLVQTSDGRRALDPQPLFAALESVRQAETTTKVIREVEEELEQKGWSGIEVIEGEVDSVSRWGGLVLESAPLDADSVLYTVVGRTEGMYENPISAVVKLVFHRDTMKWDRQEVLYVSEAGRDRSGNGLEEILPADDADLWDYMYSY